MLLEPWGELVDPVVELARTEPARELGGRRMHVALLLSEQVVEELEVLPVGGLPRTNLTSDHRADVGGDEHPEALLPRHLRTQLAEQVLGDRVEQLRCCR